MVLMRRMTLAIATAVSLLAVFTVASVGAAGGFGQAPGHYTFNDASASVSFFDPVSGSNQSVSVDRSLFRFKPKGGGAMVTQNMTVLSVAIFVANPDPTQPPITAAFGCFVIPDSDFAFSSDLQQASLNATVGARDSCPGFLSPVIGTAPAKDAGGGGGGGFTFPLTVTASWAGTGLVGTQDDQGRFTCGSFNSGSHTTFQSALSSAAMASISGFGTFSSGPNSFASVNISTVRLQVTGSGVLPAGCVGGGKGG
jgi:hypothetical protein